jgi:hypothetical protein
VVEQRLPVGQPGERDRRHLHKGPGGRHRGQITRLDGDVVGRRAITVPVGQRVDRGADRYACRSAAERGDYPRNLVSGNHRAAILPRAVLPGRGLAQLGRGDAGGVDADERITDPDGGERRLLVDELLRPAALVETESVLDPMCA